MDADVQARFIQLRSQDLKLQALGSDVTRTQTVLAAMQKRIEAAREQVRLSPQNERRALELKTLLIELGPQLDGLEKPPAEAAKAYQEREGELLQLAEREIKGDRVEAQRQAKLRSDLGLDELQRASDLAETPIEHAIASLKHTLADLEFRRRAGMITDRDHQQHAPPRQRELAELEARLASYRIAAKK